MSSYNGYYINLDRSADRREAMEKRLSELGIAEKYMRFSAVDGGATVELKTGEAGCFLSHLQILEASVKRGVPVHIMEDDAVLSRTAPDFIEAFIQSKQLENWDIVFTSTFVPSNAAIIKNYKHILDGIGRNGKTNVSLLNAKDLYYACTDSCLYSLEGMLKIAGILRQHVNEGIRIPVDLLLRRHIRSGKIRAAIVVPFISTVDNACAKTITGRYTSESSQSFWIILRNSFYIERDFDVLEAAMPPHPDDRHARLLSKWYELYFSGAISHI